MTREAEVEIALRAAESGWASGAEAKVLAAEVRSLRTADRQLTDDVVKLTTENEQLRIRVDELRPMAAHGVRNPPEVVDELQRELAQAKFEISELRRERDEARDNWFYGGEA